MLMKFLKPTRERKHELQYSNLVCEHSGTVLIKAVWELNSGRGGKRWGSGKRESTEARRPPTQTPKPHPLKTVQRIIMLSLTFHQQADSPLCTELEISVQFDFNDKT